MPTSKSLAYLPRDFKGSRLRCLLLTHRSNADVAGFFTSLVTPAALVTSQDQWAPGGFLKPDEAKLGATPGFLVDANRELLTRWWLARSGRANTPNWDLLSAAHMGDRPGLILVEAKAHEGEIADDRCGATDPDNFRQIEQALADATLAWNGLMPGFSLSANSHYQMSNRFAFAWKLATMRVPVVLVYLGFLNAEEMTGCSLLRDHAQWRKCVVERSRGVIPETAWDRTFDIDGTPLTVLIRSAEVRIQAVLANEGTIP
jgi:hypothetical protein